MGTGRSVVLPPGSTLLFECVCGSRGYGLHKEDSDWDIHGVFMLDPVSALLPDAPQLVNSENNDCTYWELRRFLHLLGKSNPSALELLGTVNSKNVLYRHPLMDLIRLEDFLAKGAIEAFRALANSQVSKARGANKKFMNPMPQARKTILDFCYVPVGAAGVPVKSNADGMGISLKRCGLAAVDGAPGLFAVFEDSRGEGWARGLVQEDADCFELRYSSIPKGEEPVFHMFYNQSAFKKHCIDHRNYWDWVAHRNEQRYQDNMANDGGYDAKNMMHAIRPLVMAKELACGLGLRVDRELIDRESLLAIKAGEYSYEALLEMADTIGKEVATALQTCALPERPMASNDAITREAYRMMFNISLRMAAC